MDLNQDQRELLQELTTSETWPALIKFLDVILSKMGEEVLFMDIHHKEHSQLLISKARYDGARALAAKVAFLKETLREKRPSPKIGRK